MADRLEVCSTAFVVQAFSLLALARLIRDHYLRLVAQATVTSAWQHASWSSQVGQGWLVARFRHERSPPDV